MNKTEYKLLRNKYDTYHDALSRLWAETGHYGVVYPEDKEKLPPSPTNDEISAIELYEFTSDPPNTYFAYIDDDKRIMTTWTGEKLGDIWYSGNAGIIGYKSNFGDLRKSIHVKGVNGIAYHGIYFASAGDYCRIKAYKDQSYNAKWRF